MGRGLERRRIFDRVEDKKDFLGRLGSDSEPNPIEPSELSPIFARQYNSLSPSSDDGDYFSLNLSIFFGGTALG